MFATNVPFLQELNPNRKGVYDVLKSVSRSEKHSLLIVKTTWSSEHKDKDKTWPRRYPVNGIIVTWHWREAFSSLHGLKLRKREHVYDGSKDIAEVGVKYGNRTYTLVVQLQRSKVLDERCTRSKVLDDDTSIYSQFQNRLTRKSASPNG